MTFVQTPDAINVSQLFNLMTFVPDSWCYQCQSTVLLFGGSEVFSEHKPIIHHYMTLLIIAPSELDPRFVLHAKHIASSERGCCPHSNVSTHPSISLILLIINFVPLSRSLSQASVLFSISNITLPLFYFLLSETQDLLFCIFFVCLSLSLSLYLAHFTAEAQNESRFNTGKWSSPVQKNNNPPPSPKTTTQLQITDSICSTLVWKTNTIVWSVTITTLPCQKK